MMTHRIGWSLALFMCVLAAPSTGPAASLVILDAEKTRVLECIPLEPGEQFSLEFINSIYLAPVKETLVYDQAEGIMVVGVESPSGGVFEYYGLEPDGSGSARLRRPVGEIRLRTTNYEHHVIRLRGRALALKGIVPDGEALVIKARDHGCHAGPAVGR